jgi:hypothetical protein
MQWHEKQNCKEAGDFTRSAPATGITRLASRNAHDCARLRATTGHDLAVTTDALERYAPAEKLTREQLHRVRDIAMVVRNRRLRPEKGRRKDLRKIENLISDLRPLVDDE